MERPRLHRLFSTLILYIPFLAYQASGASVHQRQNVAPPTELPDAWSYQGCYVDSVDQRTLRGATFASADQTASTCISFCTARGYLLAGTEYGNECFCGNSVSSSVKLVPDGCSVGCAGDVTEACGGPNQISVYKRLPPTNQNATFEYIGRTGNWSSLGCYSDAAGARILSNGGIVEGGAQNVSAESCIASCEASRYKYAGTEYSYECYCGNTLENDHEEQEDGCDMTCTGNSTQFCGGANRINIYGVNVTRSSTSSSSSVILPSSTSFSSSSAVASSSSLPFSSSIIVSISTGFSSSLAVSTSSSISSFSSIVSSSTTAPSTIQSGSTSQTPPTFSETSLDDGIAGPSDSSTSLAITSTSLSASLSSGTITSALPSNSTVPEKKKGWHYEGCYTDGVGGRSLSIGTAVPGTMTNAKCQAACRTAGYTLAGTEYSAECYCDNRIRGSGTLAPDGEAQCNMPCSGDTEDICGGPNRLSLYKYYTGDESTVSASATSSSVVPIATGLPRNFTYKGCYVDGPGFRIMNNGQPDDQDMTIASCANKCASLGYEIAGMEYSVQCFCDNMIRMGGKPATSESECSNRCGGNSDQICGGPSRLSIWSSQATLKVIQVPKPVQNVSDWTYQGCITDYAGPQGQKVFPWQSVNQTGNSPEWCLGKCAEYGYMAAGMEYGEECYCGDLDGVEKHGAETVPETDCATPCPGNPEAICGQGNRLSWYKWEGDPLYVWHYPKGIAAGRYEFLVGGPIIPLISQPGVNGKISLLEKHGTGAPNTTGAYELDPSIGGDIFHAFRELKGIKTDIFCAAGLTMPDRAGRQINIGGWSVDSLFGVRVYWPDGSLGVNGTNDWQEDVNTVKLQRGRWYPTGLVMANGSMLIVGGQDGSNGPPVPNMEILPKVGPVLEAQYLRDTDPYNLYPYLVVLPSGGIFIQYYNEARILDEVTLDTIKILPKTPGSVNDPKAGRTYPYEGTQVLFPQYYPYSAPLEVLICGGAAKWPRWGLDNCVSIEPDVANPTWTIERMPSRRVISCMATLPDGTFLILNGAETGEAGFGLADNANLNAVLYDPSKPRHERMSIMANTTIPRMYHSEAVVMDDGRVLVSGSDPQDNKHPQEYRLEVFLPPYLLSGAAQPSFSIAEIDWNWEGQYAFTVSGGSGGGIQVSLMGSESSTHGSSMGARILFPQVSCAGTSCTVTAPKGPYVAPVGWYRMFVLSGPTPSHATWVRIGGDPGELGNWPDAPAFQPLPGLGPVAGRDANLRMANATTNSTIARRFES